ncbi:MAG: SDR family oxidoreductase [Bacteroidales bacterium]|nr:SDR family oxidoreductase [Bacteroidales bacterium]
MNETKVLIIGATGMAGHMIYNYLQNTNKYKLYNTVFRTKLNDDSIICDVRSPNELKDTINKIRPDYIINCVGALIKESKENPANSILLNAWLPHYLSRISKEIDARLIHISTDCVFSGTRGNYKVDDFRDADDAYGRSKALGELINERDVTIRTSIIGPEIKENGEGLMSWLFSQKNSIKGFAKTYWSGITTLELAKLIECIIGEYVPGIYNISPNNKISKFDLLHLIIDTFELKIEVISDDQKMIDKSLLPRHPNGYKVPGYHSMLLEMKKFMEIKPHSYLNYLAVF